MRRSEKLTLCPNCLPLPVSSQRAAIVVVTLPLVLFNNLFHCTLFRGFRQVAKQSIIVLMTSDVLYLIGILLIILGSMMVHELMHGLVAYRLGDDTAKMLGRLSLNPLRHIDPFMTIVLPLLLAMSGLPIFGGAKPVPINTARLKYGEWGMALVAAVGPASNLVIAFLAYLVTVFWGDSSIAMSIMLVNLGFFIFNILPIPPLDGSRVMYALAPEVIRRGMEWLERYGIIIIFLVIVMMSPVLTAFIQRSIVLIVQLFHAITSLA